MSSEKAGEVTQSEKARLGVQIDKMAQRSVEVAQEVLFTEVRRLISECHNVTLRVYGTSMRPFLEGGRDKVVLSPYSTLKKGDIALASLSDGRTVLHRIIDRNGERITLMGDGNLKGVEICEVKDIIAVATTLIRADKHIDPASRKQRFYARQWRLLLPLRRCLLHVYRKF